MQLSELQKENVRLRDELERENVARQTLQLQVESKDQLLSTMRAQADTRSATLQSSSYMIPADLTSKTPAQDTAAKVCYNIDRVSNLYCKNGRIYIHVYIFICTLRLGALFCLYIRRNGFF